MQIDRHAIAEWRTPILRLAIVAAALALIAVLSGSYAVWRSAGFACGSWPLCGGSLIPQGELAWIHTTHRLLSGLAVLAVLFAAHRAYRLTGAPHALRVAALAALVLTVAQVFMGAANPWTGFEMWARAGHLSLATLVWLDTVFMVALVLRPIPRTAADHAEMESA